jgi:cobalamin biosynthetic protein CobC
MLPGRPAVIAPGYSGHCAMWPSREATIGASAQVAELADTHDALVLARPNNPDGWSADCAQLAQAAERLATRGGWLVLDEAFVDAAPGDSLAALDWPGLIILRSFGKFFGLAGLRLGFVVADPEIGARLRHLIGDWPISGPALAAGRAAYADRTWQAEQRKRLTEASGRLVCLCAEHDLEIVGSTAFFTLVRVPARDALFVHLAHHGVLTRPFSDQPDWLRIGLPKDKDDWARLTNALGRWRR